MPMQKSVLLISGSSHTAKTTFATNVAELLGWNILSTDKLGRHPGRPWPTPKSHVFEYYSKLSDESIYQFLLNHYENLKPLILQTIARHTDDGMPLILEGSALRPEYIVPELKPHTTFVCLSSDTELIKDRILNESNYNQLNENHKAVVNKFITRTLRDNEELQKSTKKLGLQHINLNNRQALEEYSTKLTNSMRI